MTSSLSSLPPTSSHESLAPTAVQAPRRTYGRQRPISPPPDDAPISLFQPATSSATENYRQNRSHNTDTHVSPARGLLNRFSAASTSWRDSLSLLDANRPPSPEQDRAKSSGARTSLFDFSADKHPSSSTEMDGEQDDEEDDVDIELVKVQMERLRREARAQKSTQATTKSAPTMETLQVPKPKMGPTSSSSSLTPPPSSPPGAPVTSAPMAPAVEEETMPIRRSGVAGPSGRVRRVVQTDSDDDEPTELVAERSGSPQASSHSPTPRRTRIASHVDEELPSLAEALEETASSPSRSIHGRTTDKTDDFFESLQDDEQTDDEGKAETRRRHTQTPEDLVGLFDEDEPVERGKKSKIKPLNKKDMELMKQDLARVQREKVIVPSRPEAQRLPMSSYLISAAQALRPSVPGLTRGQTPKSSPTQTTPPDEIASFTPSSHDRHIQRGKSSVAMSKISADNTGSSSPTPMYVSAGHRHNTVVPATSDGTEHDEEEELPDIMKGVAQLDEKEQKVKRAKEQAERLRQIKLAAVKAKAAQAAVKSPGDDDDFTILPDMETPSRRQPKARFAAAQSPSAKAVLAKSTASPTISKRRQDFLRRAGRSAKSKADVSETYLDFAGKTFDHAGLRRASGGSRPAGQKSGRDKIITIDQVNARIQASHNAQVASLRNKKEEEWGRVRSLPQKQARDLQALIEASARQRGKEDTTGMDEEDDDGDDDDFEPEAEEADEGSGSEDGVDERGSDKAVGSEAEEGSAGEDLFGSQSGRSSNGTNKENRPASPTLPTAGPQLEDDGDEDEDITPVIRRVSRPSRKIANDSDDETDGRPSRQPLTEVNQTESLAQPEATATPPAIDLAGFGDSGSPGFSQLFEPTQLGTEQNGLDGLRENEKADYLAVNALLPGVDISETQAERDNALVAAEVEAANRAAAETQPSTARYLNSQGYLTQTKPQTQLMQPKMLRRTSTSFSDLQLNEEDEDRAEERTPSTTEKDSSAPPLEAPFSPTQDSPPLRRLKRRSSPAIEMQPTFGSPRPNQSKNAFDQMMMASKRKERRQRAIDSNLIDEQAMESDEDTGWAPLGDEEDEDEENDEGFVPELVDDAVVDEEEKRKQDELAAAKAREIAEADDARREAEAKKITEGQYRIKRKGQDFYSDDEDDDEGRGGKRRKWSKKERRKRRLDREDGLEKLEGEANAFLQAYNEDLESDEDSTVEEESQERERTRSPTPEAERYTAKEKWQMLKDRARMNRERDESQDEVNLDRAIGFDGSGFTGTTVDEDEMMVEDTEEESQFSISRTVRKTITSTTVDIDGNSFAAQRTTESYAQYVQEESQLTRRQGGGAAGVSVVVNNNSYNNSRGLTRPSLMSKGSSQSGRFRPPSRADSSSSGGSILQSRGSKFN